MFEAHAVAFSYPTPLARSHSVKMPHDVLLFKSLFVEFLVKSNDPNSRSKYNAQRDLSIELERSHLVEYNR